MSSDWNSYFIQICHEVARNSKCLSRQIGAILVSDRTIISSGYNGPPKGVRHCFNPIDQDVCPRRSQGFRSGEGLHLCPAVHAEVNCIAQAAYNGINTKGSTMYMTCGVPCKNCAGVIINAGINELVCASDEHYDVYAYNLFSEAGVKINFI